MLALLKFTRSTFAAACEIAGNLDYLFSFGETEVQMATQNSSYEDELFNRRGEKNQPEEDQEHDIEIPAIRHVGPTLESAQTREDEQLADAVDLLRDMEEKHSIYEPGPDAPRLKTGPDPLITRLPGDTSSDPHTDVGPDNASVLQHRGEGAER